jgi:hypothetical protein
MAQAFGYELQRSVRSLNLLSSVRNYIQSNSIKLGGLEIPRDLDANTARLVRNGINQAFVFSFRLIMVVCAILAILSAGIALRMVSSEDSQREHEVIPGEAA